MRHFATYEEGVKSLCNAAAHERGYQDHGEGYGFLDNPFDSYTDEGRHWIDGYVKAHQDSRQAA